MSVEVNQELLASLYEEYPENRTAIFRMASRQWRAVSSHVQHGPQECTVSTLRVARILALNPQRDWAALLKQSGWSKG